MKERRKKPLVRLLPLLSLIFLALCLSADEGLSLTIGLNNPFNPAAGEQTRFDYSIQGRDANVVILVYSIDGKIVRQFPPHLAAADTPYSQIWDGLNDSGQRADTGTYLAVLKTSSAVIRRRVVLRQK